MPLTQEKIKQLTVDDLLDRIIEESAEVIQAASKFKRFGYDNYNPFIKGSKLNIENLGMEFLQLEAFIAELFSRYDDVTLHDCVILNKMAALEQEQKYKEVGVEPGT